MMTPTDLKSKHVVPALLEPTGETAQAKGSGLESDQLSEASEDTHGENESLTGSLHGEHEDPAGEILQNRYTFLA